MSQHETVLERITAERERQINKWSVDAFDFPGKPWLAILGEEFGEVAEATVTNEGLVEELIQVATVASFWAEELLRQSS